MGGRSIKKYLSRAPSREDPENENSDGEGKKSKRPSKESRRESFSKVAFRYMLIQILRLRIRMASTYINRNY